MATKENNQSNEHLYNPASSKQTSFNIDPLELLSFDEELEEFELFNPEYETYITEEQYNAKK